MKMYQPIGFKSANRGVSLVEVMIAVFILGIGMLGIAAMQAIALSNSQSSVERSQAVIHAYSMLDAMRANRNAALTNAYTPGGDTGLMCAAPAGGNVAANDVNDWMTKVITSNQAGCGRIQNNAGVFTVTVQWNDQRGSGGSATESITAVSRL